MYASDEFPT